MKSSANKILKDSHIAVENNTLRKPNIFKKTIIIIGVILIILIGLRFGILGGLLGAALASIMLRKTNTVSTDSVWVKETKGITIAKYIVLGIVLILIIIGAIFIFTQE
jgi:hypothetical protein